MTPAWSDLTARARGLSTHLLDRQQLESLAGAAGLRDLADGLRDAGFTPAGDSGLPEPADLEVAVRRMAAARLRTLERWCGRRAEILVVVFEDEDRRSLRAILRGAAHGAASVQRLAGLIPTPGLPLRALTELARQASVGKVATLLTAWKHPYGAVLFPEASATTPDLLKLELALSATFFDRARRAARRAGRGGPLARWVAGMVDAENAATALVLAAQSDSALRPAHAFLPHGASLGIVEFEEAIATGTPAAAARRLTAALPATGLAEVLQRVAGDPAALEEQLLRRQLAVLHAAHLIDPLEVHAVLHFALRLRAEVMDLRRIIWGVALGVPAAQLTGALVSS